MISFEQLLSAEILHRWGWTLLHSLWQLAIVGVLLAFLLRVAHRRTASTRYVVACLGLTFMFLTPMTTYFFIPATGPEIVLPHAPHNDNASVQAAMELHVSQQIADSTRTPDNRSIPRSQVDQPAPNAVWSLPLPGVSKPARLLDRATSLFAPYVPWMVLVWAIGVIGLSVRHLGGYLVIRRLSHLGVMPVPESLDQRFRDLKTRLRVTQPVRLLQSILVEVPVVVGWLRPVILAPAAALTGLSPQALEAVMAHELAHVRRGDYLVNLLQTVVETLLFYHPAVWWVSRQIRIEREHCCDDVAVAVCGSRVEYAQALTTLEEGRRLPQLALAATSRPAAGATLSRIRRILGVSSPDRGRACPWLGGLITLSLLAFLAVAMPLGHAQGQRQPESPAPEAASAASSATPSAGKPDDSPWGETVEGASVRLRSDRTRWNVNEAPRFTIDFRNQGPRSLRILQSPVTGTFEVDGTRRIWTLGWMGGAPSPLPPGQNCEGLKVSLGHGWQGTLAPGKHTIRYLAYPMAGFERTIGENR